MTGLVEFFRDRLKDREEAADSIHSLGCAEIRIDGACDCGEPERVRREVEARRRMLEWHDRAFPHDDDPCTTQCLLVLPDADHPDYLQEWRP